MTDVRLLVVVLPTV